jgi:ABC-type spermidine/putrescine transport systems, ATPase components
MNMIELSHVSKWFGEKEVLRDISITIEKGEIFTFIGPSGTGKSTLLRLINLLDTPTSGSVLFDGKDTAVSEREKVEIRRRMSMVFQKPVALKGNVYQNVAAGLKFRGMSPEEISNRVPEGLELVGLEGYGERNAGTLSGGELQRVAIARAIVTRPEVILLDEPSANLDPVSTEKIENLIGAINSRFRTTIILSTHDMVQGQRLATQIAVVLNRTIGQIGSSHDIFYRPHNREVAHMVGVENILEGTVISNEGGYATIDVSGVPVVAICPYYAGQRVTAYLRPEDLMFFTPDGWKTSARNQLEGVITKVVPMGPMVRVKVKAGITYTAIITRRSFDDLGLENGGPAHISFKASGIHVVPEEV